MSGGTGLLEEVTEVQRGQAMEEEEGDVLPPGAGVFEEVATEICLSFF